MSGNNKRPLGEAQLYILSMVSPEWPTPHPDRRAVRVLRTLEARGLAYENRGRWYISTAGQKVLDDRQGSETLPTLNNIK